MTGSAFARHLCGVSIRLAREKCVQYGLKVRCHLTLSFTKAISVSDDRNEATQTKYITPEQFEAGLLRQEHRLFRVLYNYFIARPSWPKGDIRRSAAFEALLYLVAQAITPAAAIAGTGFVGVVGLLLTFHTNRIMDMQTQLLERQTQFIEQQSKQAEYQTALADAARRAGSSHELANVLSEIASEVANSSTNVASLDGEEIKEAPLIKLTPALYSRIVALLRTLRPYRFLNSQGKLIDKPLSPERGQLLIVLTGADVDLKPLARTADFSFADLEYAELPGKDLSELKLSHANMRNAKLMYADFSGADIRSCDFSRADLCGADLSFYTSKDASFPTMTDAACFDGASLRYCYMLSIPTQLWNRGSTLLDEALVPKSLEPSEEWEVAPLVTSGSVTEYPVQLIKKSFHDIYQLKLKEPVTDILAYRASILGVVRRRRKSFDNRPVSVRVAVGIQTMRVIPLEIRKRCVLHYPSFSPE